MIYIQCAICREKQKIVSLYQETFNISKLDQNTFSARRTPDRTHYKFVKCLNCGLIFSSPILEKAKIHRFYFKSNFNYQIESEYLKKTYGHYLEKILPKKGRDKIKLLDIGCGNGFFLEEAKRMGVVNVFGIEPGEPSVKKASPEIRKNIKINILREGLFKKGTFDIICCFHTLDHIIDPNSFLQITFGLLKKGGKVLFIMHDTNGLSVKLFGEKSAIYDIEHIYLFNQHNLTKIFYNHKFKKIKTFSVKNRYPLQYWMRMVPLPQFAKPYFLKMLQFTGLGEIPFSVRAGNIGIVASKTDRVLH